MKFKALLCLLFACFATAQKVEQPPQALQSLADDFWQWRARNQPFSGDDIPRIEHPEGRRDWSMASIGRQQAVLKEFEARLKKIDAGGWTVPQRVDYRLMGSALARAHWELNLNRRWEKDPSFYTDQSMNAADGRNPRYPRRRKEKPASGAAFRTVGDRRPGTDWAKVGSYPIAGWPDAARGRLPSAAPTTNFFYAKLLFCRRRRNSCLRSAPRNGRAPWPLSNIRNNAMKVLRR
jgi:hypothetical protein